MVRTYKPRNRLCKFSKLSEAETVAIITSMIRYGPSYTPELLKKFSLKTLRRHRQAFADYLTWNRDFRHVVFGAFDRMGLHGLSRLQYFDPAARGSAWDDVHRCIFRCPSIIQPALLTEAARLRSRRISDSILVLSIIAGEPIEVDDDQPVRRNCIDCNVINDLSLADDYLIYLWHYGQVSRWTSRRQVLKLVFAGSLSYGLHKLVREENRWNPDRSGYDATPEQWEDYLDLHSNYIMQHIYDYMVTDPMSLRDRTAPAVGKSVAG